MCCGFEMVQALLIPKKRLRTMGFRKEENNLRNKKEEIHGRI